MKFLIHLFLLLPTFGLAQQPSHYILGEQQLDGVDVYDILHATNGNYFIATSSGLMVYNGYHFNTVSCPNLLRTSVFNLVEDYNGNVYCHNLSGQIFKIKNNSCKLFYTIPDSVTSSNIGLVIDNLGQLVVKATGVFFLDDKANIIHHGLPSFLGQITRLPDSSLLVYSNIEDHFFQLKNNTIIPYLEDWKPTTAHEIWNATLFGDSIYYHLANSCQFFRYVDGNLHLVFNPEEITAKKQSYRLNSTTNSLWLATNSGGVFRFDENLQLTNNYNPYFAQQLISAVCQDAEGNTLLGTFGKGIIVIPKVSTQDFLLPNEEVITLASSGNGNLYFGTVSGKVFLRDTNTKPRLLRDGYVKSIEALFVAGKNHLLIGELEGVLLNLDTDKEKVLQIGSLKDVAILSENEVLLATNRAVFRYNIATQVLVPKHKLAFRNYCIGYSAATQSIYSGTSKGLAILTNNDSLSFVSLRGKSIVARNIASVEDRVFVATSNQGVLVFKNDTIWQEWNTTTGLASNRINCIGRYKDGVLLATDKGVHVIAKNGQVLRLINKADGLTSEKVLDIETNGNELWLVHAKGVQKVSLTNYKPFDYTPQIELLNIVVNDSLSVANNLHHFDSDEQKFAFHLSVSNLRYRSEIYYQYRLEGAEKQWQQAAFSDNVIQYRSLSPGTYTFRAKAVCRSSESAEISYKFTIATPFYMAWWFYALISVAVILLILLWFRRRLKRQAFLSQQLNELNASKLTAIQSQMNPHFIFNALNSIQDLVLKGDVTNSYTYITKFADLVRRTLNYSDKDFIDFENELKLIELYLTLEKLRFKTDFEYEIQADGVEDIQIPPMLIQPFIENALVHGLLHSQGNKKLNLKFELNHNLICTITDNGVGRQKAKEIKERQRSNHESFSVNAIKTRFEILKRNFGGNLGFTTQDLEKDGQSIGTCVKLIIPVKRKF